jgi:SGNH domain (fused to AT3 domains)
MPRHEQGYLAAAIALVLGVLCAGTAVGIGPAEGGPIAIASQKGAARPLPNPAHDPVQVSLVAVRPAPAKAKFDLPVVYRNGCHVLSKPTTHAHFCVYGDKFASRTVVLFGDSHAAQWFPAFAAAAKSEHVKLLYITKTGCPAQSVSVLSGSGLYAACDVWRGHAIALIKKRKHVNLIVLGGSANTPLAKRHTNQRISSPTARATEWRAGTRRTVTALRGVAGEIVIIRDTPQMQVDGGPCLISTHGGNRSCQTAYARASSAPFWSSEKRVASAYARVGTADFTSAFCTASRCRPVTSTHVLRWRDRTHMTGTFSKLLAPRVRAMLHQALAGHLTG